MSVHMCVRTYKDMCVTKSCLSVVDHRKIAFPLSHFSQCSKLFATSRHKRIITEIGKQNKTKQNNKNTFCLKKEKARYTSLKLLLLESTQQLWDCCISYLLLCNKLPVDIVAWNNSKHLSSQKMSVVQIWRTSRGVGGFGKGHSRHCSCEPQMQSSAGLSSAYCQWVSVPGHMGPSTGLPACPHDMPYDFSQCESSKGEQGRSHIICYGSASEVTCILPAVSYWVTEDNCTPHWGGEACKGMKTRRQGSRGPLWRLVTIPLYMKSLP